MKKLFLLLLAVIMILPAVTVNAASKGRVLVIGSSADSLELRDNIVASTGYFLNELTVPVMGLLDAGYEVVIATPQGNAPTMDPNSGDAAFFQNDKLALEAALNFVKTSPIVLRPIKIKDAIANGLDKYDAVYVPDGHAPLSDLMQDKDLGKVLRYFHENNKPTAFLCHGPIATLAALDNPKAYRQALVAGDSDKLKTYGKNWQYAGYHMTIYTTAEEYGVEKFLLKGKLPFYVAEALQIAGGIVEAGQLDQCHVVRDRELITGQNPASDRVLTYELLKALAERN